jgi:putative transposase
MSNTFSQMYVQIVFAVQGRLNLMPAEHRQELHKYICGIVNKRDQKPLSIFCMPNHLHLLVGFKPSVAISDLVRDIKAGSSKFINDNHWINNKFHWQDGFGAFTYSRNQIDNVIKYILNQEQHHLKTSFRNEYIGLLKEFEIEFDEKYLFEFYD